MVKYSMLTGAETISLKQLINGTPVARVRPAHTEKLRLLGFTEMKRGEAVVSERGREEARMFTQSSSYLHQ